jgi:hypothetical protein
VQACIWGYMAGNKATAPETLHSHSPLLRTQQDRAGLVNGHATHDLHSYHIAYSRVAAPAQRGAPCAQTHTSNRCLEQQQAPL